MAEPIRWDQRPTWGDVLASRMATGDGYCEAVKRIQAAVGHSGHARSTYGNLRDFASLDELSPTWRFRAWLLLVALGYEPAELGITDEVVPPAFSVPVLLAMLPPRQARLEAA